MDSSVIVAGLVCIAAVFVLLVLAAVVSRRRERERRERLEVWAVQHRWQYVPRPVNEWWRRLPGHNKRGVSLALSGVVGGRPVSVAEYSYTTTSTTSGPDGSTSTSSQTHHFIVWVVRVRGSWPELSVHRRGAVSRFGRTLFGDRATALGYEPFDSAFRIRAARPETVRTVFGRDLVAEQLSGRLPEWSLYGGDLMVVESGRLAEPDGIPARFGPLVRVADLIENPR
ncbi:hypothetical protein [Dactylosporangium matsuzakiense]|uniref:Uncharacterized protein n=1 Tax=Dactylosporangium matsuzakiense TaxID=53360 RepID=A0A9W6KJ56_9ACTN|nr:hypothetical protein [Dactylosporangium matsuzakiense]UWZ44544.1 hypothetical protein Dmats_45580 [Dactylosporangium matsuzakiense]GLL01942.1 hypothetical protein GCM10017581_036840 [Dactylosporangium matsuzakiense]